MPREIVTLQVGQCGNQLGRAFWHRSLHEHAANATTSSFPGPGGSSRTASQFSESMSTFFSNSNPPPSGKPLPPGSEILDLKARACLIDTEDGVVSETLRGPLRDLFASRQTLHDVSGAGNNWAHGYHGYGDRYEEAIAELVRSQAEPCDSLQSFFLMHSLGGGTGSGLGTRVLQLLADEYRGVYRFATSVLPSKDGKGGDSDVVVAPYNTVGARRAPPRENPRHTPTMLREPTCGRENTPSSRHGFRGPRFAVAFVACRSLAPRRRSSPPPDRHFIVPPRTLPRGPA